MRHPSSTSTALWLQDRRKAKSERCYHHNHRSLSVGVLSLLLLFQFADCFTTVLKPSSFSSPIIGRRRRHHHQAASEAKMSTSSTSTTRRVVVSAALNALPHDFDFDFGSDDDDDELLSKEEIEALTIPQLKQQLRLRSLKVSGKKQELVERLLKSSSKWRNEPVTSSSSSSSSSGANKKSKTNDIIGGGNDDDDDDTLFEPEVIADLRNAEEQAKKNQKKTKAQKFAEDRGKEFIDVTAYLDEDDKGKDVKTSLPTEKPDDEEDNPESEDPEVWGSAAKIVDDYEGRSPVVDGLSRTIIEFHGSNKTDIQALVIASRDALKPFLAGGKNRTADGSSPDAEARLKEIQMRREMAAKRPIAPDDHEGLDEGDEQGLYKDILHRDFSDWGEYSLTGAQLSAEEVQGVLFLSDVYGAFTDDTRALAEKIAFECQPVVVMVPDMFRGKPWKEDPTTPGFNEEGRDYEEWRAQHPEHRVNIDIRASAAVLREQYGVSSVVVWGTCYGGGRALEIGAGYVPEGKVHDIDGAIGPVPVNPEVVVAWYPTRYNLGALYGPTRPKGSMFGDDEDRSMAVMAIFGGTDKLPGATVDDAAELKSALQGDERVKDHMVKVFPNQGHGFAHLGLGRGREDTDLDRFVDDEFGGAGRVSNEGGDAEVACLLSTAFMETYSRMFLPTTGPPIKEDELASEWSEDLNMKDVSQTAGRDVRKELEELSATFKEEPLGGRMVDPFDESQREDLIKILRSMEPEDTPAGLRIKDNDDIETIYAKLKAGDDSFQLF